MILLRYKARIMHVLRIEVGESQKNFLGRSIKMKSFDINIEDAEWDSLSHEEKNHQLFLRQKALLDQFLEKGAISQAQHDKSLHDLIEKMHESVQ